MGGPSPPALQFRFLQLKASLVIGSISEPGRVSWLLHTGFVQRACESSLESQGGSASAESSVDFSGEAGEARTVTTCVDWSGYATLCVTPTRCPDVVERAVSAEENIHCRLILQ